MVEREAVSSNIIEVDFTGEAQAEEFFQLAEWTVVLAYAATIGFLILDRKFYVAPFAAAALALAVGAFEGAHQIYENRKVQRVNQTEVPTPINP